MDLTRKATVSPTDINTQVFSFQRLVLVVVAVAAVESILEPNGDEQGSRANRTMIMLKGMTSRRRRSVVVRVFKSI